MLDPSSFERLKEYILCPVCYEVFIEPKNVRLCLHKFCQDCIENYNRNFKKECPGCRMNIGCRRQLRYDFKID